MVIHFGGLRDANPPYDGVEGGCLIIGSTGCRVVLTFYGEFIGEAVDTSVRHIDLLRDAVRGVRQRYPFHIDAWVVVRPFALHLDLAGGRCGLFIGNTEI